jgi:hypothetical protein
VEALINIFKKLNSNISSIVHHKVAKVYRDMIDGIILNIDFDHATIGNISGYLLIGSSQR